MHKVPGDVANSFGVTAVQAVALPLNRHKVTMESLSWRMGVSTRIETLKLEGGLCMRFSLLAIQFQPQFTNGLLRRDLGSCKNLQLC